MVCSSRPASSCTVTLGSLRIGSYPIIKPARSNDRSLMQFTSSLVMHSRVRDCGCLVDLVVRAENLQDPFLARKPRNHTRLDGGKVRVHEFVAGLGHQCRPHQLRKRTGVRCRTAFAQLPSGSPSRVLHTLPRPRPTPRLPEASYGKKLTVTRAYIPE